MIKVTGEKSPLYVSVMYEVGPETESLGIKMRNWNGPRRKSVKTKEESGRWAILYLDWAPIKVCIRYDL